MAGNLAKLAAVILLVAAVASSPAEGNGDSDALTEFRRGVVDPDGALASWDPNLVDPCTWFHLVCDEDKRVTELVIGGNNIDGSIPPEFGNLENLAGLDLYNNNISGPIPPSFGKLKSLVTLRLDHNRLTGPIPNELVGLSNLSLLGVSNNDLCGTIPSSGPFEHFPPSSFANNPRLRNPGMGVYNDDSGC
uniref:Leucine-rich repeat-containing N-terminal plant-type domain-containing protein n=1 Tax=Leersia perrieri TaxID=77586 RepID=A0A0D9WI26_9ORYZ